MSSRPSHAWLTKPGPLRLFSTTQLIGLPKPTWLIENIIPAGGLVGLYGPPGVGKSFLAIDFAMCVATGRPWSGQKVAQSEVLYVGAEGGTGIGKRALAWLKTYGVKPKEAPVAWLTEAVPVNVDSEGMDRLFERIVEANHAPKLVVIDTLARCFDGDENQQQDMGRFIAGVDKLRRDLDSTVVIVHHTNLSGERERGNTAFRGAADCMMSMERKKGKIWLHCNKQKDDEEFGSLSMSLRIVPHTDSCVISRGRFTQVVEKRSHVLDMLAVKGSLTFDEWLEESGLPKSTFRRFFVELRENGEIIKKNKQWEVAP